MEDVQERVLPLLKRCRGEFLDMLWENGVYCWLAGGAIRDMVAGKTLKDYDLFFSSLNGRELALKLLKKKGGLVVFDNDNTTTIRFPINLPGTEENLFGVTYSIRVDLIKKHYASVESLIKSFDLDCCRWAVGNSTTVYHSRRALEDTLRGELGTMKGTLPNPIGTMNRIARLMKRGWVISPMLPSVVFPQVLKALAERSEEAEEEDYPDEEEEEEEEEVPFSE